MSGSGLRDTIDGLRAAIDALAAVELSGVGDDELAEAHLALDVEAGRLQGEQARVAAAFDARKVWLRDRARSAASWLASRRARPAAAARAMVWLGRRLRAMPATAAALAGGTLPVEHARELASCQQFCPERFAADEAFLVEAAAAQRRWHDVVRVLAAWRDAVDPDGAEGTAGRWTEQRRLVLYRRPDGCLQIQDGFLDPVAAEAFLDELGRLEQEMFEADWAAAEAEYGVNVGASCLRRTASQRRADALVEMAYRSRTAPAGGRRPEPLVTVYVDYETLTGRVCELASGAPVTPGAVAPLLTRAEVERAVFGPGNRVIELGIRTRFYAGGLRRAVEVRDRHCQWPGCDVPAARCEVDHRIPYAQGGPTTQANGRLLCPAHNRARNHGRPPPGWDEPPDPLDDPDYVAHLVRERVRALRPKHVA